MKEAPPLLGRVMSLFVVWAIVFTAMMAVISIGTPRSAKAAALCSQSTVNVNGDWTVSGDELCEGTLYTMTGNLVIQGAGRLELKDGGIQFAQTPTSTYSVQVAGTLILTNSMITVTGDTIDPYLKFSVSVSSNGRLEMRNGSRLAFPGTLTTTGPAATLIMRDSMITSLSPDDVAHWAADVDENNDAPAMTFTSSIIQLYDSGIYNIFEKSGVTDNRRMISLAGTTRFLAINSHIDIDLANATTSADLHNTIDLAGTSQAYLMWPTMDDSQTPAHTYEYSPPVVTAAGTAAYIYRRVEVTVVDSNGAPVNAALSFTYTGTTTPATFPDNSGLALPSNDVLTYLGRNAGNWATTDEAGQASIPLVSDRIESTGIEFVGNYNVTATNSTHIGTQQVGLAHWPLTNSASNFIEVIVVLSTLVQPLPDLRPESMTYIPQFPKMNDTITITIMMRNDGPGSAKNVLVRVYDNIVSPITAIHNETIPLLTGLTSTSLTPFQWQAGTGGTHLIIVVVDPLFTVTESNEGNNQDSYALVVTPLGPDLEAVVPPMTGFAGNPVDLVARINNIGDAGASGVVVSFYVGSLNTLLGTNSSIPPIPVGGSIQVTFSWVPPSVGTYVIYAWADPNNIIPEPPPYSEANNQASNNLTVDPAPNPTAYSDEIGASDPYPVIGPPGITLNAVIRNIGQADITSPFNVRFSVDGTLVEQRQVNPLAVGSKQTITTTNPWVASSCGYHTLRVDVDSSNVIVEGTYYEADNNVSRFIQAFQSNVITYSTDRVLQYLPVAQNIVITGNLTIAEGSIVITEPQEACSRVFIKIIGNGALNLINSTITVRDNDNWPAVIFVGGNGKLKSSNSKILLNTNQGDGIIEVGGNGVLDFSNTIVKADISARGATATLKHVTFQGKKVYIDTQGLARIWDPTFQGTTTLALRSDDMIDSTADIDLRNATLNSVLTGQLVFGGHQYVELTSVTTTKMTRWWEGTITQKAKVTRYWWLTVEAVDGTGAVLRQEANANLTLCRLNIITLLCDPLPNPMPGINIYYTKSTTWPASAPNGKILYRAASEDRYASDRAGSGDKQWMNATYRATGTALINGTLYTPDQDVTGFVNRSMTFRLVFSRLTPDLSISSISFSGMNGALTSQPLNMPLTITAIIRNTGEIDVPFVKVNFYYIDVDTSNDGYLDNPHNSYLPEFINSATISVPLSGSAPASVVWDSPTGSLELTYTISVVVDPPEGTANPIDGGPIKETNELNNILKKQLSLFIWPDLHLEVGQIHMGTPIQDNPIIISVDVRNVGTNDATDVTVELTVDGNPTPVDISNPFNIARNSVTTTQVEWTPTTVGQHNLTFTAKVSGLPRNTDYKTIDNTATMQVEVMSSPDLEIRRTDYPAFYEMTSGATLDVPVKIYNMGQTDATLFSVGIFVKTSTQWPPPLANLLISVPNLNLSAGKNTTVVVTVPSTPSIININAYNFTLYIDSTRRILEYDESNNAVNVTVFVIPPAGVISITSPTDGKKFEPGQSITVVGVALTSESEPLRNLPVEGVLRDASGIISNNSGQSDNNGLFVFGIPIPSGQPDGQYTLTVSSSQGDIQSHSISIIIEKPVSIWDMNILGLPLWLFLLIIIIIVVVIVAVVAYTRIVGLGKMVECGECGAFIPEDSAKCPKCGVEFEKDMAKCSNCQAWIPLDVKQCPECGVEFATGEVEMADYEQKMKTQYEEVTAKFRKQAEEDIGRPLSDQEFNDWWRRQPSFVTFQDWLREEEDMRKMGSKPCPTCRTLNSITATVCHRCGTLLKKDERRRVTRPPPKGPRAAEAETAPTRAEEVAPTEAEPRPTEPVPKKVVVRKPVVPTVVQKKVVVKKPVEEESTEEGESTTSDEEEI